MGFSFKKMFSGSGWKKFKRAVGGVVKIGLGVIPGVGGVAGGLVGKLLNAKGAVGKVSGVVDKLGKVDKTFNISKGFRSTAQVLKASPVMPGGSYATPYGVAAAPDSGMYPQAFGTMKAPARRKPRRKKKAATRKPRSSSKRTSSRRKTRGRLPKFGSPAWRKKFGLDKKRRKAKKRGS